MKTCLAIMARNEMDIIQRTVPAYAQSFEHRIALDTGSTDGTDEWLEQNSFVVERGGWKSDFSEARNRLLAMAEKEGMDWCVMLDADEAMFAEDATKLIESLPIRLQPVVYLPRYNIAGDFDLWANQTYPDPQGRVIRLKSGVKFKNKVHEAPYHNGSEHSVYTSGNADVAEQHIYHYGWCKSAESIWRRTLNYIAIGEGRNEPSEVPATPPTNFVGCPPLTFRHPLNA